MRFLVQKIKKQIAHDFAFELMQAREFYKWLEREKVQIKWCEDITFSKIKNPDRYIPIGSVEFVSAYIKKFYPKAAEKALKPLNVPDIFLPYAKRQIVNVNMEDKGCLDVFDKNVHKMLYFKSNSILKYAYNALYSLETIFKVILPKEEGEWQVSEYVDDIESEWRVFVFNGVIQHVANYSGDSLLFPDAELIKKLVDLWQTERPDEVPKAYTLDLGVSLTRGTMVMECHRFFSCGLYGFSDHARIPKMFSQEWYNMKNLNK